MMVDDKNNMQLALCHPLLTINFLCCVALACEAAKLTTWCSAAHIFRKSYHPTRMNVQFHRFYLMLVTLGPGANSRTEALCLWFQEQGQKPSI